MDILRKIYSKIGKVVGRPQREDVLRLFPTGSTGAELGVFKGSFSKLILRNVQPLTFYLVDVWWEEFGEYYPDWGQYTNYGKLKTRTAYDEAVSITKHHDKKGASQFYVGSDIPFINNLPDKHLDWVYIDSSHEYEHTKTELEALVPKIKNTGIIAGHDWYEDPAYIHHGVCKAVKEFCNSYNWEIVYRDSFTQWAIKRKTTKA